MSSGEYGTSAEERQDRSLSQGSIGSQIASWFPGSFSPPASSSYLDGEALYRLDSDDNDLQR
jgi:hypothetical protein